MRRRTGMTIYVRKFEKGDDFAAHLNDRDGYASSGISAQKAIDHLLIEADYLVVLLGVDFITPVEPIRL